MRIRGRSWLLFLFLACAPGFASAQGWDLAITKTGPEFAPADTDVTYAVSVTNTGPDDATTVAITDVLPAGMTFVLIVHRPRLPA